MRVYKKGENIKLAKIDNNQKGFFQCAIFYGTPIAHELDCYDTIKPRRIPKELREELENQKFVFPFYSNEIFPTQKQAEAYLPGFIQDLIKRDFLPPTVLDENKRLRDDICKAAIVPLKFSVIDNEEISS